VSRLDEALDAARRRLDGADPSVTLNGELLRELVEAVEDAGVPRRLDLVGAREFCELLGVRSGNLRKVSGLPAPDAELHAGPVWRAPGARAFARRWRRERRAGEGE
jgi:hypothetical protein